MPSFSYQAINEAGETVSGVIEADTVDIAANIIADRGYIPSKVKEQAKSSAGISLSAFNKRLAVVKAPELILFTRQFRTMLKAGVPMLRLLQVLENQTENQKLKEVVASMSRDTIEGVTLYNAFKKHPKIFSNLYCSMIRAGESSGALPNVFDRLIYIMEHEHRVKSDIKDAMLYPATVVVALVIAFFVLLTFVIPKFASVFGKAGLALPLPTRVSIWMYELLFNYWHVWIVGTIAIVTAAVYYFKTEHGKYIKDLVILKLPIFGSIFLKAIMSRFASIFAILEAGGVPILESMSILSGTIGNSAISREFDMISERLRAGGGISGPLKAAKYFPPIVVNMIAIGEESGNMDDILRDISVHYDDEVQSAVQKLSAEIGPILIVGLAIVVGFFALSVFLPMWDLSKIIR